MLLASGSHWLSSQLLCSAARGLPRLLEDYTQPLKVVFGCCYFQSPPVWMLLLELLLTSSGVLILTWMDGLLESQEIKKIAYVSFSGKQIIYTFYFFFHQIFKRSQYPKNDHYPRELVSLLVL